MAIAAVGEGTSKVMQNELGKVVECVFFFSFFFVLLDLDFSPWGRVFPLILWMVR